MPNPFSKLPPQIPNDPRYLTRTCMSWSAMKANDAACHEVLDTNMVRSIYLHHDAIFDAIYFWNNLNIASIWRPHDE